MIGLFVSNVCNRLREWWRRPAFVFVADEHSTYGAYLERYRSDR